MERLEDTANRGGEDHDRYRCGKDPERQRRFRAQVGGHGQGPLDVGRGDKEDQAAQEAHKRVQAERRPDQIANLRRITGVSGLGHVLGRGPRQPQIEQPEVAHQRPRDGQQPEAILSHHPEQNGNRDQRRGNRRCDAREVPDGVTGNRAARNPRARCRHAERVPT